MVHSHPFSWSKRVVSSTCFSTPPTRGENEGVKIRTLPIQSKAIITVMKLSVVITIFNEESTLDSLMQALKKQTLPPAEILIGDGGSTDGSIAKLEAWKKDTFFRKKLIF